MVKKRNDTTIPVTKKFKKWLKENKIVPGESYEHLLKRLLGLKGE